MTSFEARTGRHRQRYENNFRLVSGCIPYRLTKDDEDVEDTGGENKIEVLMVSSPNRSDLVFPKGGWEDDETVVEAACREALEEAGVKGVLRENPLGVWEFRSKSRQDLCSLEGGCKGYMFALEVTEELDVWPEQENRSRRWLNTKDAFELCRYEWMREALGEFLRVMTKERQVEIPREEEQEEEEEEVEEEVEVVSEVVVEDCQIISSNCHIQPSTHALNSFTWQIPLKRLPLT